MKDDEPARIWNRALSDGEIQLLYRYEESLRYGTRALSGDEQAHLVTLLRESEVCWPEQGRPLTRGGLSVLN